MYLCIKGKINLRIMKQITLNIDERKFKAFLNFIKTLDYVSVSDEIDIPIEQQHEVERRFKLLEEGKMKTRSWNEAKQDVFKR
jgi:hypothetical protein